MLYFLAFPSIHSLNLATFAAHACNNNLFITRNKHGNNNKNSKKHLWRDGINSTDSPRWVGGNGGGTSSITIFNMEENASSQQGINLEE